MTVVVISEQQAVRRVVTQIVETSDDNEPLTFEVGAGEVMGNKMFQVAVYR